MPPKQEQKPSKKAVREKKARAREDMTFGMKNKNKSAKVKLFIERAEKAVKQGYGSNDVEAVSSIVPGSAAYSVFNHMTLLITATSEGNEKGS